MALFLAMFPVYLLGNVHCLGMCGPLVAMLGQHRFRYLYFFGRTLAFGLAGLVAGEAGAVLQIFFQRWHLGAFVSIFFGASMVVVAVGGAAGIPLPGLASLSRALAPANQRLSLLLLRDTPCALFFFGFFTLLLPCGQSLLVFSACALASDRWVGLGNGVAFAVLTSPALLLAMQAKALLPYARRYYHSVVTFSALIVAALALLRGLADLDIIPHVSGPYHLVLF